MKHNKSAEVLLPDDFIRLSNQGLDVFQRNTRVAEANGGSLGRLITPTPRSISFNRISSGFCRTGIKTRRHCCRVDIQCRLVSMPIGFVRIDSGFGLEELVFGRPDADLATHERPSFVTVYRRKISWCEYSLVPFPPELPRHLRNSRRSEINPSAKEEQLLGGPIHFYIQDLLIGALVE